MSTENDPFEATEPTKKWWRGIVAICHAEADKSTSVSLCYFIGGATGPIKIGFSIDPKSRLSQLRQETGVDLRILATAPGGKEREGAYHTQFAEHRLHGEWFDRHRSILAEIRRLKRIPEPEKRELPPLKTPPHIAPSAARAAALRAKASVRVEVVG